MKAYISPAKSSADGGTKNLNLPLFLPLFLALAAENTLFLSTPLVCSSIVFKSELRSVFPSDIMSDIFLGPDLLNFNLA